jgi:hypothetical protein
MRDINFDEHDEINRPAPERMDFDDLADNLISRRSVMRNGLMLGAACLLVFSILGRKVIHTFPVVVIVCHAHVWWPLVAKTVKQ